MQACCDVAFKLKSSRLNYVWACAGAKCGWYGVDRVTAEVGLAGLSPPQQCVWVWPLLHSLLLIHCCFFPVLFFLFFRCSVALGDYLQHPVGDREGVCRWKGDVCAYEEWWRQGFDSRYENNCMTPISWVRLCKWSFLAVKLRGLW